MKMKDPDTPTFRRSDAPTLQHPDTSDFAGGPSDPPTLRRSGPRASRLALRPVQVPVQCSAPFGATSFGISFAHFILRGELLSQNK